MPRVLIAGGDGFIGWPLALELSEGGAEILIVDNLLRRELVRSVGADSLRPIASPAERITAWRRLKPQAAAIRYEAMDIADDPAAVQETVRRFRPDTLVHLATIPSAPYSMKDLATGRRTVRNNTTCTWALMEAVVASGQDIPVVHIGTMGVYGYDVDDYALPEGYLEVEVRTAAGAKRRDELLHPMKPGSLYHLTKAQDQLFFEYYNRQFGVRITDLHQGIVWGISTPHTALDAALATRFDYDSDFGTVLNRFALQAACKMPLTVYGAGSQRRALIHLGDSVRCLRLAVENPPVPGERVRIFNQFAQIVSVNEIAQLISEATRSIANPRIEREDNAFLAENEGLKRLGWKPTLLSRELVAEIIEEAGRFLDRLNPEVIGPMSYWRRRKAAT